jgi:predicted Zn-dependent protease
MKHLMVLVVLIMTAFPAWSDQVPVTGRHQDMTFTPYEVNKFAAAAYHKLVAKQARQGLIDTNPALVARVRRITQRLVRRAEQLKYEAYQWHWEVHVSDADDVSAFSMAGGKLLVGSHFIRKYRLSDGELAMVLAHEIAHALAEHVREQLSEVQLRHPRYPYTVAEASAEMGSDIAVYLSLMPLSELQEGEADHIGVYLLAASGYPPEAALGFFRKLVREDQGQRRSMFATHMPDRTRLKAVVGYVAEAKALRSAAATPVSVPARDFQ